MKVKRLFLIVLDSVGAGETPDADKFGDVRTNTIKSVSRSDKFNIVTLKKFGYGNIDGLEFLGKTENPVAAYGRIAEMSAGKDTTIGHWEIGGIVSEEPMPTYPDGFPDEVIEAFENATGEKVLCNKPYSGTQVILDYGREHTAGKGIIVYTSADSVFQIAAHEDIVSVEKLYEYCRIARKILTGKHAVGRVIARPFTGRYPDYVRTAKRHDFSLTPPKDTILDAMQKAGYDTVSVGKIYDIFAGRGIDRSYYTHGNTEGMSITFDITKQEFSGICFVNLVDFDMLYGHRNDIDGYASAMTEFDTWLDGFVKELGDDDVLMICADHGCDPGFTQSTDHSREYIPIFVYGKQVKPVNLGTRNCFADIAATIAEMFGVELETAGKSFMKLIDNDR